MRQAFTLFELLCVVVLISLLMAITLAFLPSTESRLASQGADQLQTYIAAARARAMRDNVASGIRLIPDETGIYYRQVQFIQTPEPFAPADIQATFYNQIPLTGQHILIPLPSGHQTTVPPIPTTTPPTVCLMRLDIDCSSSVSVGDLLETVVGIGSIQGMAPWIGTQNLNGQINQVNRVMSVTMLNGITFIGLASSPPFVPIGNSSSLQTTISPVSAGTNAGFRFIREPRPLMGETPLQLPRYVRINTTMTVAGIIEGVFYPSVCYSLNTNNMITWSVQSGINIVFSPSGQIINGQNGRIILWIDDDAGSSQAVLVCIYTRSGGIAEHPINPWNPTTPVVTIPANSVPLNNPFLFSQDGLNSGL
jgi:prepilin-type N-terminal cleavage/methylation domain-containing protein